MPTNANGLMEEQLIEVLYYYRKNYNVVTKVNGTGGTIVGDEVVLEGNDSTPDKIVITPDKGFVIKKITINMILDIIYISGGNTFATLKRIKDCGFDKEIIRYVKSGVLYIGGSAGAHIVTQNIEHIVAFDSVPEDMTDFPMSVFRAHRKGSAIFRFWILSVKRES